MSPANQPEQTDAPEQQPAEMNRVQCELPCDADAAQGYFKHVDGKDAPYAIHLYLNGLGKDPSNASVLAALFDRAGEVFRDRKLKIDKTIDSVCSSAPEGTRDYLKALLGSVKEPFHPTRAVAATEAAGKFGIKDAALFLGDRAERLLQTVAPKNEKEQKAIKGLYVKLMDAYAELGCYEKAANVGDKALKSSRDTDPLLQKRVQDISALAYTERDVMQDTGVGGFRGNIRNADAQRELEESERLVRSDQSLERELAAAREAFEARPQDAPTAKKYAEALAKAGELDEAIQIYERLYEASGQKDFFHAASELRLRREQRSGGDASDVSVLELKRQEYQQRLEIDPDKEEIRAKLASVLLSLDEAEESARTIQPLTRDDNPKVEHLLLLGRAFAKLEGFSHESEVLYTRILADEKIKPEYLIEAHYGMARALLEIAKESPSNELSARIHKHIAEVRSRDLDFQEVETLRASFLALSRSQ